VQNAKWYYKITRERGGLPPCQFPESLLALQKTTKGRNKMNAVLKIPKIYQITAKQSEDQLVTNLKLARETMESRCRYYSLDLNTVFSQFAGDIQANEYEKTQKIPGENNFNAHFENAVKDFMIKQAYFSLEKEEFIPKIVHKISNQYAVSPGLYPDILDYVRNELEKKELKRLKRFNEEGKFTTFLYTVTRNLVLNFLDNLNDMNKAVTMSANDLIRIFHELDIDPLKVNIQSEKEEMLQKIEKIVETLDAKVKVVFKMFYYENVDVSKIARTFAITWHKTNKLLKSGTSIFLTKLRKTKYFPGLNLKSEELIRRIKKLRRQK
jgi:RNA polymerase sigma factor (sigma-70 family)